MTVAGQTWNIVKIFCDQEFGSKKLPQENISKTAKLNTALFIVYSLFEESAVKECHYVLMFRHFMEEFKLIDFYNL